MWELGWRCTQSLPGSQARVPPWVPFLPASHRVSDQVQQLLLGLCKSLPAPSHLRPLLSFRPRHFLPGPVQQPLNWLPCLCLHPLPVCLPLCFQGPLSKRNIRSHHPPPLAILSQLEPEKVQSSWINPEGPSCGQFSSLVSHLPLPPASNFLYPLGQPYCFAAQETSPCRHLREVL